MRKKFLAGNWKMNYTSSEAESVAKELVEQVKSFTNVNIMIAPAFTSLDKVSKVVKGTNVLLGAQNISPLDSGARTGSISAKMLLEFGVDCIILGHSECRIFGQETNCVINSKVLKALESGFKYVILCVGETLEEREAGKTFEIVLNQVEEGLKDVKATDFARLVIAYEPVWAIGTGKTASSEQAQEVHEKIRSKISELYSSKESEMLIIQYGGSVKLDNVQELMSMKDIDGALVGGASLKAADFAAIIEKIN